MFRNSLLFFLFFPVYLTAQNLTPKELIREGKIDSALIVLTSEIQKAESERSKAFLLLQMGNAYKMNQEYEKALGSYREALRIFKKEKSVQEEFYTYAFFSELYRYVRQYQKAEDYLKSCEKILKKHKIKDDYLMKFYDRKSALFSEHLNDNDSALVYSQKALTLAQKTGDQENAMISMMEIAVIHENKKNHQLAIQLLKNIINIAEQHHNKQLEADAMVNLCRNYNLIKEYDNSIKESLKGLSFSKQNNLRYNELLFADNLHHAYQQTHDYEKAYEYLTLRLNLTEEYYQRLHDDKFLEYETKFQTAEKQRIIDENKKVLKLNEEELKRQNLIKYFILFGLVCIIIFAAILLNYIKIIRKQNKELIFVSEQNEFLVSETHHRINNNLQLITILIENELDKIMGTDEISKKNILAKIDSLGLLHRQLYRNKDKKDLNVREFLLDIRKNLNILMTDNKVEADFEIQDIIIPINQATYIGILTTELCINSLKHAFEVQNDKKIKLVVTEEHKKICFSYCDNGKKSGTLPKLVLIDQLCRQLNVEYKAELNNGFRFKFVL